MLYPDTRTTACKVQEEKVVDAAERVPDHEHPLRPERVLHHVRLRRAEHRPAVGREDGHERAVRGQPTAIGETWTYGYTPDLVAGVWAGNADNSPMHNITSTSISYRAVRDFMMAALVDTPASRFDAPARACRPSTPARRPA